MKTDEKSSMGLVPLTETEIYQSDGALGLALAIAGALGAAALNQILSDWDDFKLGLAGKARP